MNVSTLSFTIDSESDMEIFSHKVWEKIESKKQKGFIIYLSGDLGAGKTTFVRGFLRAMGYTGVVKSPTYTLVEPYDVLNRVIFHFDLYRLNNVNELEDMGIRDYFQENAICLIEWPEKANSMLPLPDVIITIDFDNEKRNITITIMSDRGQDVFQEWN